MVQIVDKRAGVRRILEHVGSAHGDAELAVLMQVAREPIRAGQDELDLGLDTRDPAAPQVGARVVSTTSQILWDVLTDAYARLGFDTLAPVTRPGHQTCATRALRPRPPIYRRSNLQARASAPRESLPHKRARNPLSASQGDGLLQTVRKSSLRNDHRA